MSNYGVTDKGFVLKRMDTILEEIHSDLTDGYGFDTRVAQSSFLSVLVTSFAGKIADLWEVAQDNYYSKNPATATGINLDNAVQYGGISRMPAKQTCYPLHCRGEDGTVSQNAIVATNTLPEVKLYSTKFQITRSSFNSVSIVVASVSKEAYSITINGEQYSFSSEDGIEENILNGLKNSITSKEYIVTVNENILFIDDTIKSRNNVLILSNNLTTKEVTSIVNFYTYDYGKIDLPNGIITKMINNITGFNAVNNLLTPNYGRLQETDIELRQSYIAKSALRSNTMLESIEAELLNNVAYVESAKGYENYTNVIDERGLPPHSIEMVVEGGNEREIAEAILKRKAGGIQTYGNIKIDVPGRNEDIIPIYFNRPDYLYTWFKIKLSGDASKLSANYVQLTINAIMNYLKNFVAGKSLLIQLLMEGIYSSVSGITHIDIYTAYTTDNRVVPDESDYAMNNVIVTARQKIMVDETRIEVTFNADS